MDFGFEGETRVCHLGIGGVREERKHRRKDRRKEQRTERLILSVSSSWIFLYNLWDYWPVSKSKPFIPPVTSWPYSYPAIWDDSCWSQGQDSLPLLAGSALRIAFHFLMTTGLSLRWHAPGTPLWKHLYCLLFFAPSGLLTWNILISLFLLCCVPVLPQTHYMSEVNLEPLILLPSPPQSWPYRHVLPPQAHTTLGNRTLGFMYSRQALYTQTISPAHRSTI